MTPLPPYPPLPRLWAEFHICVAETAHRGVLKVHFPVSCPGLPIRAAARAGGQEEAVLAMGWPRDLPCGIWSFRKQDVLWAEWVSSVETDLTPEREEARNSEFGESL